MITASIFSMSSFFWNEEKCENVLVLLVGKMCQSFLWQLMFCLAKISSPNRTPGYIRWKSDFTLILQKKFSYRHLIILRKQKIDAEYLNNPITNTIIGEVYLNKYVIREQNKKWDLSSPSLRLPLKVWVLPQYKVLYYVNI